MGKKNKKQNNFINKPVVNKIRPVLDIVIPVYGNYEMLEQCLLAIPKAAKDVEYRIYLVDDKSPDYEEKGKGFYNYLRLNLPKLGGILINNKNGGYAYACNRGANLGSSRQLMILTTDVILMEDSIKIMSDHLDGSPEVSIVFPKLLFFPNSNDINRPANKIQHCGIAFDINKRPIHLFIGWDSDHPFVNRVKDYNAMTGAVFIIRRELFRRLNGFDESYGKGTFEDVDLAIRVRMTGGLIRYLPMAVGYHGVGMSVEKAKEEFPVNRNFDLFKSKFGDIIPFDEWML